MVKSDTNPDGTPLEVFDQIRAGVLADRSQFYKDLSAQFYGTNREGSQISQGARDDFWRQGMTVGLAAAYACVKGSPRPTSPTISGRSTSRWCGARNGARGVDLPLRRPSQADMIRRWR